MSSVDIHSNQQLYIQHRKLYAVQILPENLPRIFNMFQEWAMRYDVPRAEDRQEAKFTMQRRESGPVLEAGVLDYLVWGPSVPVHFVKSGEFEDIYEIKESIK